MQLKCAQGLNKTNNINNLYYIDLARAKSEAPIYAL